MSMKIKSRLNISCAVLFLILFTGFVAVSCRTQDDFNTPTVDPGALSDENINTDNDATIGADEVRDEDLVSYVNTNTDGSADDESAKRDDMSTVDEYPEQPDGTVQASKYAGFYITPITDEIFDRIYGKSYPANCTIGRDELRYVHVSHYDFEGGISDGELIVNAEIADVTLEIFKELFDIEYRIEKIRLIDEYDADDERSMEDNNSSAFNFRYIAETTVLSNHASGYAIDINTLYNPYVYTRKDGTLFLQPENAEPYVDRDKDNPYYIRPYDDCCRIFKAHGFAWGGDWQTKKDYQHFEYIK